MITGLVIACGVIWMFVVIALFLAALEAGESHPLAGIAVGLVAVLVFAMPLGLLLDSDDKHANQLCLSGHEEWTERTSSPVLVGKVIVPGHRYTTKQWVCTEWSQP